MFGGMASKIGILAKKATGGGGGADVTPTDFGWSYQYFEDVLDVRTNEITIGGIDTTINIFYEIVSNGDGQTFYYSKNGGTFTSWTELTNLSLSNGDTLRIQVTAPIAQYGGYSIITIKNASDGNAVLAFDVQFYNTGY